MIGTSTHCRWLSLVAAFVCMLALGTAAQVDAALFVGSPGNNTIKQYNSTTGAFINTFVASGLDFPTDLKIGPDGNLYVNNFNSGAQQGIRKYDGTTGALISGFITLPGANGGWEWEYGPDGNLYTTSYSTHEVRRYDASTGAPIGGGGFVTAGSGGLVNPEGLAWGPDGNLYVGSRGGSNRVLKYNGTTGAFMSVFVSSGGAAGGLNEPSTLLFGPDGNLYVVDQNNATSAIHRYNGSTGAYLDDFISGGPSLANAADAVFGPDGNFYIARSGVVHRFNGTTGAYIGEFVSAAGSGGLSGHGFLFFTQEVTVPEPGTLAMAALGLVGLVVFAVRRASHS